MLVTIKSIGKNKIHVSFQENLIQTQNVEAAVMAFDCIENKFINVPISEDSLSTDRYIFYAPEDAPETGLFELFFGEIMSGYIKLLNDFNIAPEPSRFIGFYKDLTEDDYKQYAERLNLPTLDFVLEAAQNG